MDVTKIKQKKNLVKTTTCCENPSIKAKSHGLGAGPPDIQHLELLRPSVALVAVGVRVALLLAIFSDGNATESPSLKKCHEERPGV
jgi:hypothetical protein